MRSSVVTTPPLGNRSITKTKQQTNTSGPSSIVPLPRLAATGAQQQDTNNNSKSNKQMVSSQPDGSMKKSGKQPLHQDTMDSSHQQVLMHRAAPRNKEEHFELNAQEAEQHDGSSMSEMLRLWGRGSRNQRVAILTRFVRRHRHSTSAEIEKSLGHGALLFFTHITAWLRLTYMLGYELSVQLSAISLFLQGQKFLSVFMENGGIQLLTDLLVLQSPQASIDAAAAGQEIVGEPSQNAQTATTANASFELNRKQNKQNCVLLLLHIANSGRVYREMICDGSGTDSIVRATLAETNDAVLELTAALFLSLGQGNPRKAVLVHSGLLYLIQHGGEAAALCAATTLRSLQLAKEATLKKAGASDANIPLIGAESGDPARSDALLDAFFRLLRMDHVKLRFEGAEMLSIAAKNHALTLPVLSRCLDRIDDDQLVIGSHRPRANNGDEEEDETESGTASPSSPLFVGGAAAASPSSDKVLSTEDTIAALVRTQRQQVACGRTILGILLRPQGPFAGTASADGDHLQRLLSFFERRSAYMTILKYLKLAETKDVAAVTDCVRVLQLLCRGASVGAFVPGRYTTKLAKYLINEAILNADGYEEFVCEEVTDDSAVRFLNRLKTVDEDKEMRQQEGSVALHGGKRMSSAVFTE